MSLYYQCEYLIIKWIIEHVWKEERGMVCYLKYKLFKGEEQ
jgi:hemerythrin